MKAKLALTLIDQQYARSDYNFDLQYDEDQPKKIISTVINTLKSIPDLSLRLAKIGSTDVLNNNLTVNQLIESLTSNEEIFVNLIVNNLQLANDTAQKTVKDDKPQEKENVVKQTESTEKQQTVEQVSSPMNSENDLTTAPKIIELQNGRRSVTFNLAKKETLNDLNEDYPVKVIGKTTLPHDYRFPYREIKDILLLRNDIYDHYVCIYPDNSHVTDKRKKAIFKNSGLDINDYEGKLVKTFYSESKERSYKFWILVYKKQATTDNQSDISSNTNDNISANAQAKVNAANDLKNASNSTNEVLPKTESENTQTNHPNHFEDPLLKMMKDHKFSEKGVSMNNTPEKPNNSAVTTKVDNINTVKPVNTISATPNVLENKTQSDSFLDGFTDSSVNNNNTSVAPTVNTKFNKTQSDSFLDGFADSSTNNSNTSTAPTVNTKLDKTQSDSFLDGFTDSSANNNISSVNMPGNQVPKENEDPFKEQARKLTKTEENNIEQIFANTDDNIQELQKMNETYRQNNQQLQKQVEEFTKSVNSLNNGIFDVNVLTKSLDKVIKDNLKNPNEKYDELVPTTIRNNSSLSDEVGNKVNQVMYIIKELQKKGAGEEHDLIADQVGRDYVTLLATLNYITRMK